MNKSNHRKSGIYVYIYNKRENFNDTSKEENALERQQYRKQRKKKKKKKKQLKKKRSICRSLRWTAKLRLPFLSFLFQL